MFTFDDESPFTTLGYPPPKHPLTPLAIAVAAAPTIPTIDPGGLQAGRSRRVSLCLISLFLMIIFLLLTACSNDTNSSASQTNTTKPQNSWSKGNQLTCEVGATDCVNQISSSTCGTTDWSYSIPDSTQRHASVDAASGQLATISATNPALAVQAQYVGQNKACQGNQATYQLTIVARTMTLDANAVWRDQTLLSLTNDEKTAWLGPAGNGANFNKWVSPNPDKIETFAGHETEGYIFTPIIPPIAAAASWDSKVAYALGNQLGKEMFTNGYRAGFGVGMNLTTDPRNGRTYEYFGEDPALAGTMAGEHIRGLEAPEHHAFESAKHYALNEQETNRFGVNHKVDSRALHQYHLLPFEMAVKRGNPGGIMCAYGFVNGLRACENSELQTEIMKNQWGYDGFVYTDCCNVATPTGDEARAFTAGVDATWPIADSDRAAAVANLRKALNSGALSPNRLDDAVRRRLNSFAKVRGVALPSKAQSTSDQLFEESAEVSRQLSEQSMVLLKNVPASSDSVPVLPLDKTNKDLKIAIFAGYVESGGGIFWGGGSALAKDPLGMKCGGQCFSASLLADIQAKVPNPANVTAHGGQDLTPDGDTVQATKAADVCIVNVRRLESEGSDISLSTVYEEDSMIPFIASRCPRTVVLIQSGTALLMPWLGQVHAVLDAWYPGQRGGKAIANILFGDTNPSGKLPITFPSAVSDLPLGSSLTNGPVDFTSFGTKFGYRWFDAMSRIPLFPFGFGLSYTTFNYAGFNVNSDANGQVTAQVTLTNTGTRDGAEVAELYAQLPSYPDDPFEPPKRLVGWSKVFIPAGQSRVATIAVDPLLLNYWNDATRRWDMLRGDYRFMIASSSRDIKDEKTINLQTAPVSPPSIRSITAPIQTFAGVKQTYEIRGTGLDGKGITATLGGIACVERSQRYDAIFRAWCQAPNKAGPAALTVLLDGAEMVKQMVNVVDTPTTPGGYLRVDQNGEPMGTYDLSSYTGSRETLDVCVLQTRDQNAAPLTQYLLWEVHRTGSDTRSSGNQYGNLINGNDVSNTQGRITAINHLPNGLCNQQNWRLPTKAELLGIASSQASTGVYTDTRFFPNSLSGGYWASDTGSDASHGTKVSFDAANGKSYEALRASQDGFVRLVSVP